MIAFGSAALSPLALLLLVALVRSEITRPRLVAACTVAARVRRGREAWLLRLGLLGGIAVLSGPLAVWARDQLFARALVDVALVWVVAPLTVLGAPTPLLSRACFPGTTAPRAGSLVQEDAPGRASPLRGQPVLALAGLCVPLWFWHVPVLLDATAHEVFLQFLASTSYLVGGIVFWSEIVGSYPYRPRLGHLQRIGLIVGAFVGYWGLAAAMVYSPVSWYPAFDHGAHALLSAATSAQYAGAFDWALPAVPLGIATLWCFSRWLAGDSSDEERLRAYLERARLDDAARHPRGA